jgi:amidase
LPGSGTRFLASLDRDFKDARIGWLGDFGGWAPYEPGVLDVCETALKTFADLGATVESVTPAASPEQAWNTFIKIRQWQQGPNFQLHYNNPARRALLKPEAIWEVEESMKLTPFDVANASAARTRWTNAVQHLFRDYDFLVMPTAQVFAFDIAQDWPREIAGHPMRTYHEWMKANCLISLTGCPSLAVPAGFNGKGQAMGLQIIAPVQHDMACLQLAHAYEQAKNWTADVLPPLLRA